MVCFLFRAQVYKQGFYMRKHGDLSWKPTWTWSVSPSIADLDLGPLTREERKGGMPTTKKWLARDGKKRFQGNCNLKQTQYLAMHYISLNKFAYACLKLDPFLCMYKS